MYQYPMIQRAVSLARRVALAVLVIFLFFFGLEWMRLLLVIRRIHPVAFYVGIGLTLLGLVVLLLRWRNHRADHRILRTGGFRTGSRASHRDLRTYCRYLSHYVTRLSDHPFLQEETGRTLRQQAADIDEILASHPLNDDLYRCIQQVEEMLIPAAFEELEVERERLTTVKIKALIEDVNQPPFPVIVPVVVLYHQVTLISLITDCFVTRPSISEYLIVMRDVWTVLTKGDFIRLGQRLFEGVYINAPPMGRASNDLGQALATIWMTHTVANAAAQRCRSLHSWNLKSAIAAMETQTVPTLHEIREEWTRTVMPLLKIHIRHNAPAGTQDTAGFTESVVRGITKSIETVVQSIAKQEADVARSAPARRTAPGPYQQALQDTAPPRRTHRVRKHRKRRRRGDPFRVFRLLRQRSRYQDGPEE